jgi:hypothetical protein
MPVSRAALMYLADDALGQLQGAGDLLVGQVGLEPEAQAFFDITHGYSLRRHPSIPRNGTEGGGASGHAQRSGGYFANNVTGCFGTGGKSVTLLAK